MLIVHLLKQGGKHGKRLFNNVIESFKKRKVGFSSHQIENIGRDVVNTITNTMWFLDPFIDKLKDRSVNIPAMFKELTGYRNIKKQHQKAPQVRNSFEDI